MIPDIIRCKIGYTTDKHGNLSMESIVYMTYKNYAQQMYAGHTVLLDFRYFSYGILWHTVKLHFLN